MSFQRKSTLAIILITFLVIGNQAFIVHWLSQKKHDVKVINLSGKQRMLSQKIIALTFYYQIHQKNNKIIEIESLFKEWETTHYSLINGDASEEIKAASFTIRKALGQLTPQIILTESIIKNIDGLQKSQLLKFEENQTRFLIKMDEIVKMYETESNQKIYSMIIFQFLFSIIIIGIVVFEMKFVFEPIAKHLNKQNSALQNSNKILNEYAYIVSHDLRSPIRNILSFISLLKKSIPEKLSMTENVYLKFIEESALRMNKTTIDLLDYSTSNKVQKKEVDIVDIIRNALDDLNAKITDNKALIIIGDLPKMINVDEILFRLLLQNLISNSIKFMKEETIPRISISSKTEKNNYIFCVSDNGIGIKKEYHEKIFKIFNRLHNRVDFEGTGIGLSLCKRIIEGHDGKIWVESEIGKGSQFYFSIPK
ncbi:MAG: signal transduction histidine kinase [Saprospiraceae bacterium]|jgi:chemotaxis family two-component system sensor kinase Cph1